MYSSLEFPLKSLLFTTTDGVFKNSTFLDIILVSNKTVHIWGGRGRQEGMCSVSIFCMNITVIKKGETSIRVLKNNSPPAQGKRSRVAEVSKIATRKKL
jgi:hypothetical protein